MQHARRRWSLSLLLLPVAALAACGETTSSPLAVPQDGPRESLAGFAWTTGSPTGAYGTVAPAALRDLPGWNAGNGLIGPQFWKSNNAESLYGEGWMMSNGRVSGINRPITGQMALYLSHLNLTGGGADVGGPLYVHLLIVNAGTSPVTVTGKGTIRAGSTPVDAVNSPYYLMANDWLANTLTSPSINLTLAGGQSTTPELNVNAGQSSQLAMVKLDRRYWRTEGRFELNVTGGSVYVYAVSTADGSSARAWAIGRGASGFPGKAAGYYDPTASSAYGREAGIATNSAWWTGNSSVINLPTANTAHMGLALNTNALNPAKGTTNVYYQDQTAAHFAAVAGASPRTWAGYGHKYNVQLGLKNPSSYTRRVRVSMASNPVDAVSPPAITYNGPVMLQNAVSSIRQVLLKPTAPKQLLADWAISPGQTFNAQITFYVPGYSSDGQQLIFETYVP